jgi:hypothetical protein
MFLGKKYWLLLEMLWGVKLVLDSLVLMMRKSDDRPAMLSSYMQFG